MPNAGYGVVPNAVLGTNQACMLAGRYLAGDGDIGKIYGVVHDTPKYLRRVLGTIVSRCFQGKDPTSSVDS